MPRSSPPSCPGAPQHTQEPPDMPRSLPMTHPGAPPPIMPRSCPPPYTAHTWQLLPQPLVPPCWPQGHNRRASGSGFTLTTGCELATGFLPSVCP